MTHSHLDHSPLAAALSEITGTQISAFGPSDAGRSKVMQTLGDIGGGEGIDPDFVPDIRLRHGAVVLADGHPLRVLHTPGHMGNHICLRWQNAMFTGDHVMGWSSTLISPPDGDLSDFMASCLRVAQEDVTVCYPGHGPEFTDISAAALALYDHRKTRKAQILAALTTPQTAAELAAKIYTDTPPVLLPAATRNVLAHLIDLLGQGQIATPAPLQINSRFKKLEQTPKTP